MRQIDKDGLLLCTMQGNIFEESINRFTCSSEIFIRRFTNSNVVKEFDNISLLDNSYSKEAIFESLIDEYGKLSYGKNKYTSNEMFWIGYTYRYFCYTYDLSMKQVYAIISPKEMRSVYLPYHSLDCSQAIERILEAKNISFSKDDILRKGVNILRVLKKNKNPYIVFPVFGNERFLIRKLDDNDVKDLIKIYPNKANNMKKVINYWDESYNQGRLVKWGIVDKENNSVIGTIEQSNNDSNNSSIIKLDLRSDYEKKDIIINILELITPSSYNLFNCDSIKIESYESDVERTNALYEMGFTNFCNT